MHKPTMDLEDRGFRHDNPDTDVCKVRCAAHALRVCPRVFARMCTHNVYCKHTEIH